MRSASLSPKEYRDFAAQCFRWAARSRRDEHKNMMLDMADHWMRTAQRLESGDTPAKRSGRSTAGAAGRSPANVEAAE
jgi:hypothetical protein